MHILPKESRTNFHIVSKFLYWIGTQLQAVIRQFSLNQSVQTDLAQGKGGIRTLASVLCRPISLAVRPLRPLEYPTIFKGTSGIEPL